MRKFMVNVNGNSYEVEVEEIQANAAVQQPAFKVEKPVEAPVKKTAPLSVKKPEAAPIIQGGVKLTAPLPGTILKYVVQSGSVVKENDVVLIIEAMKMENEIRANASGIITFVAAQGASVNSGDIIASIS